VTDELRFAVTRGEKRRHNRGSAESCHALFLRDLTTFPPLLPIPIACKSATCSDILMNDACKRGHVIMTRHY
jgi:hypothetical protein